MANIDPKDLVKFANMAEFALALDPSTDMLMPWQEKIMADFGAHRPPEASAPPIHTTCAIGLVHWSETSDFTDWKPNPA